MDNKELIKKIRDKRNSPAYKEYIDKIEKEIGVKVTGAFYSDDGNISICCEAPMIYDSDKQKCSKCNRVGVYL